MATLHGENPAAPEVAGSLIPEPEYNAAAATAGTTTEDLLRLAADDGDEGDQIVYLIEQAAQQLAEMGMTLRVLARHLAAGNVPGADRARLQELADGWAAGESMAPRQRIGTYDDQRLVAAAVKACGVRLQHYLDGDYT